MEGAWIDPRLTAKLLRVKLLALDCDGVMAPLSIDTGVIMDLENAMKYHDRKFQYVVEIARFNHRDGHGIDLMKKAGIHVVVVTSQRSGYIDARCFKLGVPCLRVKDKRKEFADWLNQNYPEISMQEVCYMGDDINDIPLLKAVGFGATVADAVDEAKKAAVCVTKKKGGEGAVREVCDLILEAKGVRK